MHPFVTEVFTYTGGVAYSKGTIVVPAELRWYWYIMEWDEVTTPSAPSANNIVAVGKENYL